ncbi:MAG: phosphoenolpyruvate--protein phosphotransferase [Acidobacteria bacterium]|nr:phosphoenolpyruvate--protein phosphotransferase [Acidobacteriota bacterium]
MSRKEITGSGVSPGIAIGKAVVQETRPIPALRIPLSPDKISEEIRRFHRAVKAVSSRIRENQKRAEKTLGHEYAAIFEAHRLIATDPAISSPVEEIIRSERVNAEWALEQVVSSVVSRFENLGDLYFADRRLDFLDVATQILRMLQGQDIDRLNDLTDPVILVADELPPSLAVQLPLDKILGFALEMGGPSSHTTIIARSFGIPTTVGLHGACREAMDSNLIALDAFEGKIVFDPDPAEIRAYESKKRNYQEQQAQLLHVRNLPAVTRDGRKLRLLANVDLPMEVDLARQWNVDGIGLHRSEFLYMKMSPALPSEMDHLRFYRDLVRRMEPRPVTIRTFDLGGKKLARDIIGSPEANPVLGLRGIRLCLSKPDFFRTQLRALLRLAGEEPEGRVRIMIPLISGIEEFRVTRLFVQQTADELRAEGFAVPEHVPLGAMVEVPSAALMATELAHEADFLSIGTNDLIQYTIAVDRANEMVANLYQPSHPAILRLVHRIILAGAAEGIDVAMCGETAADPLMVPLLVGLGLTNFSMNPQAIPVVRHLVRHLSYRESAHIAREALKMTTARAVEEYLLERLAILFAKIKIRI